MNIKTEFISTCRIAYFRRYGAYGLENIHTMEKLKSWATTNNLMDNNTIILGITHDDMRITPLENCRYDACIIITDQDIKNKGDIEFGEISEGKYAVFTIPHTAEAMENAWVEIFPALYQNGYFHDNKRPILERYTAKQLANHLCEICVPII